MKTICFFNSEIAWGGGEKWHLEMAKYLKNKGYRVVVYCHKKGELQKKIRKEEIKIRLMSIGNISFLNPFKVAQLILFFRKDKPDAVIFNISKDIKVGGLAAKLADVNRIIYRRGSAIPIKDKFLNRWYFRNVITQILTNSFETKKTINQKNVKMFPENKISVIYNGLNLKDYDFDQKEDENVFIIGNLGRVEYQKNQIALLELAVILKQKISNFKIVIGGSGKLLAELKQKAKDLNINDVIEFKGYIKDVSSFMSRIDVFVLTSHWEGFGYVVVEASYFKKPVIAYNVSSNPEVIINNETGFLIDKDNIDEISTRVIQLKEDRGLLMKMGNLGHDFVKKKFDAEINSQKVESYLSSLV